MVYLQTTYELCFGEAYFEYFESCDFSRENTNIDVSVFMFDLTLLLPEGHMCPYRLCRRDTYVQNQLI